MPHSSLFCRPLAMLKDRLSKIRRCHSGKQVPQSVETPFLLFPLNAHRIRLLFTRSRSSKRLAYYGFEDNVCVPSSCIPQFVVLAEVWLLSCYQSNCRLVKKCRAVSRLLVPPRVRRLRKPARRNCETDSLGSGHGHFRILLWITWEDPWFLVTRYPLTILYASCFSP